MTERDISSSRSSMLLEGIHKRAERIRHDIATMEGDAAELFKLYQDALAIIDKLAKKDIMPQEDE